MSKKIFDFVEYINNHYRRLEKVIEIGVGRNKEYLDELRSTLDAVVVSTDIEEEADYIDDVTDPDLDIYIEADLIYSIRPPIDIQEPIASLAKEIGAELVIVPFKDEIIDLSEYFSEFGLKNYGELVFYEGII